MIECKEYTLTELRDLLHISKRQWEDRKEEVLQHLSIYFNFTITKMSKGYCVSIKEQYAEYEPLPRKIKTVEVIDYYYNCTKEEVKDQPWNTGSNIARNIIAKKKNKYDHAEGTIGNYIRPIIKSKFLSSTAERQWMRLSDDQLSYIPLDEEQMEFLISLLKDNNEQIRIDVFDLFNDFRLQYITNLELGLELQSYIEKNWYGKIMSKFKSKYGFTPMHVKKLQEVQNFNTI